jgi:integrase
MTPKSFKKSLFKNPVLIPAKPGLSPFAQSASLCLPDSNTLSLLNNTIYFLTSNQCHSMPELLLVDLMLSGGLRISEVLNPPTFQINMLGQVYIVGSKGSNSKLVTPLFFRYWWQARAPFVYSPFINYSRFFAYRLFKKHSLVLYNKKGGNNSCTHSLRHLQVSLMQLLELPQEELSRLIGHKSLTAIKYYLYGNQ